MRYLLLMAVLVLGGCASTEEVAKSEPEQVVTKDGRIYPASKCVGAIVNGECHGQIVGADPMPKRCQGQIVGGRCVGVVMPAPSRIPQ